MSGTTFALASCQYPADMLERMPDATSQPDGMNATPSPADASLLALGRLFDPSDKAGAAPGRSDPPSMLLLVGDQVYTDATAGLFDPKASDDQYRIPYETRDGSRGWGKVLRRLNGSIYCLPDDHEIIDNWEPGGTVDPKPGIDAYLNYQRPYTPTLPVWSDKPVHGGLPFFLGDTRTERDGRTVQKLSTQCDGRTVQNWRTARIMKKAQYDALCAWMVAPAKAKLPKFFAAPSALLPRRLVVARDPACALHSDAWDGYPCSLHALLAYACDNEVKGLVFLSGDEHISDLVRARVSDLHTGKQCTLHSVHSSALYAPYPFANAIPEDFARSETFRFPDPPDAMAGRYCCEVETMFAPPGDGFAVLKAQPSNGGWQLEVIFHGADGPKDSQPAPITLF